MVPGQSGKLSQNDDVLLHMASSERHQQNVYRFVHGKISAHFKG